ncbi:MAG: amidohydrolase [Bacillota bacterium]|nr:amidohydrolase [Bacillota bacterium]MDW7678482.1 amidohydrolase [Bacillota bacterium]
MNKEQVLESLDSMETLINDINLSIWANPEVAGKEQKSADLYRKALQDHGFTLVEVEGMPHAFYGEYGTGSPVIAVLGEYDALPGLSQALDVTFNPVTPDGPGHGCGHNLLGAAPFGAALAVKKYLEATGQPGTIRYYGCPEEETLVGKVKMIRAGAFDGCDLALSWHPMTVNAPMHSAFLALDSMKFRFKGISAHAGQSPESGRSALDAVELMNVGANYLREHVIEKARIHYTITNAGGAPNIIPKDAESWYFVRAPHRKDVADISARLMNIARGAALMTDTQVEMDVLGGCYEYLPNQVLLDLTQRNMTEAALPAYTEAERELAASLQKTVDAKQVALERRKYLGETEGDTAMFEGVMTIEEGKKVAVSGSSDSGDVSWIMPMNLFLASTWPLGITNHSWQATAAAGSTLGTKGMMYAARVFAGMMVDLFNNTLLVDAAVSEFKDRTKDHPYVSPLG